MKCCINFRKVPLICYLQIIAGALAAILAMQAAWKHNPQGEFHDETGTYWPDLLMIGVSWFTVIAIFPNVVTLLIYFGISKTISTRGKSTPKDQPDTGWREKGSRPRPTAELDRSISSGQPFSLP